MDASTPLNAGQWKNGGTCLFCNGQKTRRNRAPHNKMHVRKGARLKSKAAATKEDGSEFRVES